MSSHDQRRLLLVILTAGALGVGPGAARADDVPAAAPDVAGIASTDAGDAADDLAADLADDPDACGLDDAGPVGDDGPDDSNASDPASDGAGPGTGAGDDAEDPAGSDAPGTESTVDVGSDAPGTESTVDVAGDEEACADAGPAASAPKVARTRSVTLATLVRTGHLATGAVRLPGAGTVTQRLTFAPGAAPRSLRRPRSVPLAMHHRSVGRAQTVRVPLVLTRAARSGLRQAHGDVRLVLRTTVVLRAGKRTVRSQRLVLRAAPKR